MPGIEFYCGIGETKWNHHPVAPGQYACISPVKGRSERTKGINRVYVPPGVSVIQDSGAFSDSQTSRLTFEAALKRQYDHAVKFGYLDQITHVASYDVLIDEVWNENDGNRSKRRWTVDAAESAIETTIAAAQFMHEHRSIIHAPYLIQSAQGVDATQYEACTRAVLPFIQPGDALGLGGWCVVGKWPKQMMPVFAETVQRIIPLAAHAGVTHVHLWGVMYAEALGLLLWHCHKNGITTVSTDNAHVSTHPCFGEWGYAEWRDNSYQRVDTSIRGLERARHVRETVNWLGRFETTPHYKQWMNAKPYRMKQPVQLRMFVG